MPHQAAASSVLKLWEVNRAQENTLEWQVSKISRQSTDAHQQLADSPKESGQYGPEQPGWEKQVHAAAGAVTVQLTSPLAPTSQLEKARSRQIDVRVTAGRRSLDGIADDAHVRGKALGTLGRRPSPRMHR